MDLVSVSLQPGEKIYKFKLIQRIGSGGFGEVWLAQDNHIDATLAFKIFDGDMAQVMQQLDEARIGNKLNHPNLVKIHYADVVNHKGGNIAFFAMDYQSNGSIVNTVNPGNFIAFPTAIKYIKDVLRGLEYLHEQGLYHNDIKPSNILIGSLKEGILTDYGISAFSPTLTPVKPSNFYILHQAPEVLLNSQISVLTDIYQTGMTAFRLLNGLRSNESLFRSIGRLEYEKLISAGKIFSKLKYQDFIPSQLKRIINKSCHVDPRKRFQTAREMRFALDKISFPGYWDVNPNGNLVGIKNGLEYAYEIIHKSPSLFDIELKKGKTGQSKRRVRDFCHNNLSKAELARIKKTIIDHVVGGKC